MERNLRLYPAYQALRNSMFWFPVFFLYYLSVLSLEEAVLLEAVYYVAAVTLEVPSGWFSDRLGRRPTLLVATAASTASAVLFAATGSFWPFVAAQVLKAAGNAFNSGTDSALLFDSLSELERETEIAAREGRAVTAGFGFGAVTAAIGGLCGVVDLRLAFVLTALGEAAAFALVLGFREPHPERCQHRVEAPVRAVLGHLRDGRLAWLFVYYVGMVVLVHVPFEFFQPYLDLVLGGGARVTPAASGLLSATMMLLGAAAGRLVEPARRGLGVRGTLLTLMGLCVVTAAAMGAVLHLAVMALVLLRSVPIALLTPIVRAEIHPRIGTAVRATYLSVQSLAGRLVFAGLLVLASAALEGEATRHAALAPVFLAFAAGGALLALALALWPAHSD